jgi:POT family proton-dependent oligopeptide transporter
MMGASVVLMLCEKYGCARGNALRMAGLYNAASYLAALPGGFAVDHMLGPRRSLGAGAALLALGYAVLTLSGYTALCVAVGLLLIGHALFKPATQAVIGRLYAPHDSRLDAAQTAFYLAVNAGGTVGAVAAGLLLRVWECRSLCAVSTIAMLAARLVLSFGKRALRLRAKGPGISLADSSVKVVSRPKRIQIIVWMTLAMMLYTVGFGQVEGSLFLWAQDRTDRVFLGFEIPASWFVGLPALLVLLLAPLQLALLPRIQRRFRTQRLVFWGLIAVGLAFAVLIPPALHSSCHRVSMMWLTASMTLLVVGELLVAPLGLSTVLRLAPPRLVGVVVGAWYVAGAIGYWLAGELGALWVK